MKPRPRITLAEAVGPPPSLEAVSKMLQGGPIAAGKRAQLSPEARNRSEYLSGAEMRAESREKRIARLNEDPPSGFAPLDEHTRFIRSAHSLIRRGYRDREDLLHQPQKALMVPSESALPSDSMEFCLGLIGPTGTGKSSVIRMLKSSLPPYIDHGVLGDRKVRLIQFPVIGITCPAYSSPRDFPSRIIRAIADHHEAVLGERIPLRRLSGTLPELEALCNRLCRTFAVGMILVDDGERLVLQSAGSPPPTRRVVVDNFLRIRRACGAPFAILGNFPVRDLLFADGRSARRFASGWYAELRRPQSHVDTDFRRVVEKKWSSLLVRNQPKPSEDLYKILYRLSAGPPGFVGCLVDKVQLVALENGEEKFSNALIERVFEEDLQPLHGPVFAAQSEDFAARSLYPDVFTPHRSNDGKSVKWI